MLCLAAARLASRRVAPGPPAVLGLLLALPRCGRGQGRGPASASLAAAFGTAQLTPLSVCALEDCLFHGLLGVASAVSFPGAVRRRAMPSLVVTAAAVWMAVRSMPWGSPWPGMAVPCVDARRRAMPLRVFLCLRYPLAAAMFPSNSPMQLHPVPICLARSSIGQPITLPAPHSSL